jgi:hypothetical protein
MYWLCILLIGVVHGTCLYAQVEKQVIDSAENKYEPLIFKDKAKLLNNIDFIVNMRSSFENRFSDKKYNGSNFAVDQFRLEIKGKVHEKVYFRFRDRYTRLPEPQSQDGISRSVDLAFIRVDATQKWNFQFGKMCADWGGYEFDLNPIEIYEYNDLIDNSDNFLSGLQAQYVASKKNIFTFQVLNSRTKTFKELYDSIPSVVESKFPAAVVGNWRGNFGNGLFTTLWSYSIFLEAKNKSMHYIALGNWLNLGKTSIIYDFKWSDQDVDRTGIASMIIPDNFSEYAALNVRYVEHWLELRHRFSQKWNARLTTFMSNAYWFGNPDPSKDNKLRQSWGINPTLEYYPFDNINLRFYATYVQRFYRYSDYSKSAYGSKDLTTGRISLGIVSPLLIK